VGGGCCCAFALKAGMGAWGGVGVGTGERAARAGGEGEGAGNTGWVCMQGQGEHSHLASRQPNPQQSITARMKNPGNQSKRSIPASNPNRERAAGEQDRQLLDGHHSRGAPVKPATPAAHLCRCACRCAARQRPHPPQQSRHTSGHSSPSRSVQPGSL